MSLTAQRRPILIAHRAANDVAMLRQAVSAGADFAEADAWYYNGEVEIRHEKTMGPVPLRWDRWKLERRGQPRLVLKTLLEAMPPGLGLMLDLKGRDRRLPGAVMEAIATAGFDGPLLVSARRAELLDVPGAAGAATFPSLGGERDLRRLERRQHRKHWSGAGMHKDRLNAERVQRIRQIADCVLTWPVNDTGSTRRLTRLGVDGFIIDRLDLLETLAGQRGD